MAGNGSAVKVHIDHVVKKFQTRKGEMVALNGVDLDIHENEFITVVGPSGCGKSTLLNIIGGLETPTEGQVTVDGKPVDGPSPERGIVFQQYALFPWLTVIKNVMFGLKLQGKSKEEAEEIAHRYLKMVDLEDFANHYPKELSGGMKQRVAIARAYATNPQVLLMDEPTSALDPISTSMVEELMMQLSEDHTVVVVTHNMQQAARVADKTCFFYLGELVEAAPTKELFSNPKEKLTNDYLTGRFS